MALIEKRGRFEIWSVDGEFWVYGYYASGDPKICATIGATRDEHLRLHRIRRNTSSLLARRRVVPDDRP